tara:strand:- start:1169 stop:1843 length:675 start_codon:yes stop_codon:yes gene_type:complete
VRVNTGRDRVQIMSYILDALNKSDQDRQRERAPNLKTVHSSSKTGRSPYGWRAVILLLLMANLLVFGVWSYTWMQEATVEHAAALEESAEGSSVAVEPITTPVPGELTIQSGEPVPDLSSRDPEFRRAAQPAVQVAQSIPPEGLPRIHELPTAMQRQIPDLTFASHMYAGNPRASMVTINGRSMQEGDGISGNLVLRRITQEGVILQFGDTLFQMSILRDWSYE